MIVQAAGRGGPALVLVEAKAHVGEFDCKPKPLSYRSDRDAQARTNDNHLQIGRAIAEASRAVSSVHRPICRGMAYARKMAFPGIESTSGRAAANGSIPALAKNSPIARLLRR
jgi:hypothetical protein